ncbi:MAG TPA: glycosyl hydrolase family 28-related protein [Puia sp.]|uniref:right-handed parallel beta-helix repeat-containing protein n=1 Tax=Puia sp. TaxID=2045100 RepID=UPI002BAFF4B4|nr:glycosyl hydrolase family 28-related protein [Puia sp.]HVU98948.1 glycosyl hydrolase family 28-related protein [Puia sp.]
MNRPPILVLWAALFTLAVLPGRSQGREEFTGPYSSWADVRTRFHVHGDGITDDTRALQRAIDSLSCYATDRNIGPRRFSVVYLPAGAYCISAPLRFQGQIGVTLIGEDPERTVIKWIGKDANTMFWADGSAYFKISRLTWDATGKKGMEGIGIHWLDKWNTPRSRSFAALNIEVSDCFFFGLDVGIGGGSLGAAGGGKDGTGWNDSEVTIRRCSFSNCTQAAIAIRGYNALDYWVWDCKFLNCQIGIRSRFGSYHAYRCYFTGSVCCDLNTTHGYYTSVRGCFSDNSGAFSIDGGTSTNPFKRIFQDNIVVRPKRLPVEYYHFGKLTFWNNIFTANVDTAVKVTVNYKSFANGMYEVLSLHNTYAYKDPIHIAVKPSCIYSFGDKHENNAEPSNRAFLGAMDVIPARQQRPLFEVPANADAAAIQILIDKAAAAKGQRPIVHFATGIWFLDRTLVIPPGSDMQLVGDGLLFATILRKKPGPFKGNAMILVKGPATVDIRDLQIGWDGERNHPTGIVFENIDQPGAQAHIDQLYSHADTSLCLTGLNYLYVEKNNSFFSDGNFISGGDLVKKGGGTARLSCYGGQFARLSVQDNARFLARDCWWEGTDSLPIDLKGSGTVCIDGAMIAPNHQDSSTTIAIDRFNGHISLLNMYIQGAITPRLDNPNLDLLVWNTHFYHKMDVLDFLRKGGKSKAAFVGLTAQCFRPGDPACKFIISLPDQLLNEKDTLAALEHGTAFDRESKPVLMKTLPPGVSNIYITRVSLPALAGKGIEFTSKP